MENMMFSQQYFRTLPRAYFELVISEVITGIGKVNKALPTIFLRKIIPLFASR